MFEPPPEWSVEQLMNAGQRLHFLENRHVDAERLYRRVLERDPNHHGATHFLGVLAHQHGNPTLAETLVRRSIELNPKLPEYYVNFGEVLRKAGKSDEALAMLARAQAMAPHVPDAFYNAAAIRSDRREFDQALVLVQKALSARADFVPALMLLGQILMEFGRTQEARPVLARVLALDPKHALAGFLYAAAGGSGAASVTSAGAAGKTPPTPPTPPAGYVVGVFDRYADRFDESMLDKLACRIPQELRLAVDRVRPGADTFDILDLGCGTGLTGVQFKPRARTLAGVDLSTKMIDKARERGIYDALEVGDLVPNLRSRRAQLDLILAGDVFIYVGELGEVFAAASDALRPGGLFAFSVESYDGPDGFILRPTRRYAHARRYIESLAERNRFAVSDVNDAVLRKEGTIDVAGTIFVLERNDA